MIEGSQAGLFVFGTAVKFARLKLFKAYTINCKYNLGDRQVQNDQIEVGSHYTVG